MGQKTVSAVAQANARAVRLAQERAPWCAPYVLSSVLRIAEEIAQQGAEGRRTGALFTIGRAERVLQVSRPLILDPIACHPAEVRHIDHPDMRGTIRELSQLDGAFVLQEDGTVVAACRYLDVPATHVRLPLGWGSRHLAGAAISRELDLIGIVVSQSGTIRTFCAGECVVEYVAL